MELLLNLVWLLLAVPVVALCWRAPQLARGSAKYRRLNLIVLTAGILVLLFPVVSASDDLNAMRVESEESNSSQTILKSAISAAHDFSNRCPSMAAVVCSSSFGLHFEFFGEVSSHAQLLPAHILASIAGDRAPPLS